MKREINLKEISDGKLYTANDMVKAGCGDCAGCSACCRGMGNSIVLDPLDVWRLLDGLGSTYEKLLSFAVELNVVDGLVLPNLKMTGEEEKCAFLNTEGRCSVHAFRPGICRLFPLGRIYEDGSFRYFLQVHECAKENRSKVKVRKWIDTPDVPKYEKFVNDWHYFLKHMEGYVEEADDAARNQISMYILKQFYLKPYVHGADFYAQFYERLSQAKNIFV